MLYARGRWYWVMIISLGLLAPGFAQEPARTPLRPATAEEEALVAALLAAKTETERTALLTADPARVTFKVVNVLVQRGDTFAKQEDYERALTTYQLAFRVAEQIGDPRRMAGVWRRIG